LTSVQLLTLIFFQAASTGDTKAVLDQALFVQMQNLAQKKRNATKEKVIQSGRRLM
jgi:hypothetical protein